MKTSKLVLLGLSLGCGWIPGCMTTKTTRGFQTNPPARTSQGVPHSFAGEKEKNGIQEFFAAATRGNQKKNINPSGIPPERDPTSLQSKPTVSAELLIVAGEMGLKQQQFEAAVGYFQRALQMEPKSIRANVGLAKAEAGRGNPHKSDQIYQALREWYPNQAATLHAPGQGNVQVATKGTRAQPVTYEEIGGEPQAPVVGYREAIQPGEVVTRPEIDFRSWSSRQRIENPFFTSHVTGSNLRALDEQGTGGSPLADQGSSLPTAKESP